MNTILFLAANPINIAASQKRIDEEIRTIDERLRLSELRELFDVKIHLAVRIGDLQNCLLRHRPDIVHLSVHGNGSSEIILQDKSGKSSAVASGPFGKLFSIIGDNIRCVVLNTYYSEHQARSIAEHIECVIAMSKATAPDAAMSFVASFYQALGYGKSIKTAFKLGCNQMELMGFDKSEWPLLVTRNPNSGEIVFARRVALDASELNILMKLGTGNSTRRTEAAMQLGYLREPSAIPILESRCPQEPDPTVRYWLAIGIGEIGGPKAVRALTRLKETEDDPFALLGIDDALSKIENK